jgi:hypothetical protein
MYVSMIRVAVSALPVVADGDIDRFGVENLRNTLRNVDDRLPGESVWPISA